MVCISISDKSTSTTDPKFGNRRVNFKYLPEHRWLSTNTDKPVPIFSHPPDAQSVIGYGSIRKISYYHTKQLLSVITLQNSCIPDREYGSGLEVLFDMRHSHIDKSQHEIEERQKLQRNKTHRI